MKKSRKALFTSMLSLLLCFTMFLGTTYAWFTDSVSSTNNIIKSGNLDVELEYWDGAEWKAVKADSPLFEEETLWEPGYTQVVYLRVANKGTLALKYQLGINIVSETTGTRVDETTGKDTAFKLSDSIYMGVKEGVNGETGAYAARVDAVKDVESKSGIISKGFNKYGDLAAGDPEQYLAVVVYMPESVGNEANHKTGTDAPKITLGINLLATQKAAELDSFGSDYDAAAKHPYGDVNYTAAEEIPDDKIDTDENNVRTLNDTLAIGNESEGIFAMAPNGVKLADDATELSLTVQAMSEGESEANVVLDNGESKQSFNIHVEGVAEDNQEPVFVTMEGFFKTGLNTTSVAMYHVENGMTVPMDMVAVPANHNEFSYDPATGNVVLSAKSFSEYVAVTDDLNLWKGAFDTSWYNENDTEFTLDTADKLAGFGKLVDEGNSFAGKTVKLGGDIDLSGGYSLNPIGCGYVSGVGNSGGMDGAAFSGTFDGQNHTIFGLYQNGWELGLSYCNLGGGLFASIANGTVRNLTISGANIVMECVEQGILVGLSQGNCTYENINIYNSKVANYQRATGGLIGEVSPMNGGETTTISNVVIGSDVVVGSLWGDFDAPVGGVIGGYWDDTGATKVEMDNVTVACRLDVYNDVTSTYQWYAYRRAGMLIGNSDRADGHTATAEYLTCKDVTVYYGPWVNYHYCEFNNYNSKWPWVRVEEGENCSAYSNPRYGVPTDDNGKKVVDENHKHQDGDTCMELLTFGQLYGGGQGVYGETEHAGVTIEKYAYTIQYINANKVVAETFVGSNNDAFTISKDANSSTAQAAVEAWVKAQGFGVEFGSWVNAGSTKVTEIPAGNTEDIKLYPYFNSPHTARFVDQDGNVLAWCLFHSEKTTELEMTRASAESKLTFDEGFSLDHWEVHVNGNEEAYAVANFRDYTTDVTIYPVYKFNGDVNLIPVDEDGDGDTDYYQVDGYGKETGEQELVEIPGEVNGVKVTTINADAFSSYDDLHSVRIPGTIEVINSQSFTAHQGEWYEPEGTNRDTVTLYYEGDPDVWKEAMERYNADNYSGMLKQNWDNNMGEGSRVFFLVNGKVDMSKGYWELANIGSSFRPNYVWQYHNHAFPNSGSDCSNEHHQNDTDYDGACDCKHCNGADRPDQKYWTNT